MTQKTILVVDDSTFNLNVCKSTLKDLYELYLAPSAKVMFKLLEKVTPDIILLDVEMPGIHGYEAIRTLKSDDSHKNIPVIFLSAMDDEESEMEGFDLGAVDYIHKPFIRALLIKRIETQIALNEKRKELIALKKYSANMLATKEEVKKGLHTSLDTVINMIEASQKSNDIDEIKQNLKQAKTEAASVLSFIESIE